MNKQGYSLARKGHGNVVIDRSACKNIKNFKERGKSKIFTSTYIRYQL